MPSSKSTIFFLAALAVVGPVAMTQPANALQAMGPPPVRRAEHIQLAHKMVKKRSTPPRVVPVRRQEQAPPGGSGTATSPPPSGLDGIIDPEPTNTSTPLSPTPGPNTTPTPATTTQRSTPPPAAGSSSSSSTVQSSTTSAATARSTISSASSSSSSTQQSLVTSNVPTAISTTLQDTAVQSGTTRSTGPSTVVKTSTSTASSAPQESDKSKDQDASFLPRPVIVSLIVAAACVVAAAAIWTIIRKWKFGASRRFEDRLEPVNWEPPVSGLPMDERDPAAVAIARGNSVNSNSQRARTSFGSSDGSGRNIGAAGDQPGSIAPDFPPPHDFTAGVAHLGPGAGYTDLQRGPSPAPSMNYSGYSQQFSTPNPYDAYDYNSGYGGYGGAQQPSYNNGPGPHQF